MSNLKNRTFDPLCTEQLRLALSNMREFDLMVESDYQLVCRGANPNAISYPDFLLRTDLSLAGADDALPVKEVGEAFIKSIHAEPISPQKKADLIMLIRKSETTLLHAIVEYEMKRKKPNLLHPFSGTSSHMEIFNNLINYYGADIEVKNGEGVTPLQYIMNVSPQISKYNANLAIHLIKLGANPQTKDILGKTLSEKFTEQHLDDENIKLALTLEQHNETNLSVAPIKHSLLYRFFHRIADVGSKTDTENTNQTQHRKVV